MSEIENNAPEYPTTNESVGFDIASVFNKKPVPDIKDDPERQKKQAVKKTLLPKKEELLEANDKDEEKNITAEKPTEEIKSPEVDYKAELEKLQKRVKDTQGSFHEDRKKLAAYKKAVEKMKQDGALLDEEATMLLDHTHFEDAPEEEPLFVKYGKVWDKELEYMKKYAPNPKEIDQHILAFQHLIQTSSPQEINDILSDLSHHEEDEVEFTRQMLEIGRQYNDDIYSDIHETGSIRNLKAKYIQKETELQKKIDKLEKHIDKLKEKYEDFNTEPSNYRLPSGSSYNDLPKEGSFDLRSVFEKQGR